MRKIFRVVVAITATATVFTARAALVELSDAIQVSVGYAHACVVTSGGGVKCWGLNSAGQLGDGTASASRPAAGDVAGLTSGVAAVATGGAHACALMNSGAIKCWGANDHGQLGDGTTAAKSVPVDVINLGGTAVAISAGFTSTCAVLSSGALRCWGANDHGQLGDGTTTDRPQPTAVSGMSSGVAQVSVGTLHTCAVTTGGAARCWGANQYGELGDGTTTQRLAPVDVASLSSGVASITAGGTVASAGLSTGGGGHTCAVTVAGAAKCWGRNDTYALGDGTQTDHLTPFDVSGLASGAAQLSAAGVDILGISNTHLFLNYSCGVTSGGVAKCWGLNYCGLMGDGSAPACTILLSWPPVPTPSTVLGASAGVLEVSTGGAFACALTNDTRVKCWGWTSGDLLTGLPVGLAVPIMTGTLPQAIAFGAAPSIAIAGTGSISATSGPSGIPIVFTSLTPAVCSVSGSTVSGLASGLCTIAANQAGNAYFDPAPQVTQGVRIGPLVSQAITFGPAPVVVASGVGNLSATASSGLPVSFASNTPSICSTAGSVITGLAAGTCTVAASQGGDLIYAAAPQVTQTFSVAANDGTYGLAVTRAGSGSGAVTSIPSGIDCGPSCGAGYLPGAIVSLTAAADVDSVFQGWSGDCTGTGGCAVRMAGSRNVTATFGKATDIPRLGNIATRMQVRTGDDVLIGGFIIGGSVPKTVVIRARGPSLAEFGLTGLLVDPKLDLYSGQTLIASNDNWPTASNAAAVSASGFAPSVVSESAIMVTLNPGPYTAIVSGADGGTGIGIVEVFEVDRADVPLVNIATRGQVLTGNDVMIGGFVIQGSGPQTVVVRARGPSLASQGVPNTLGDPVLVLFSGLTPIAANDNWSSDANAQQLALSGFAPPDTREAAILVTLNPGAYTAVVAGANGTTGIGIVEVFAQ